MRDHLLMAEVPLGPFEGAPITVYSAKGKNVRLPVARACSQLRTSDVRTAQVSLDSAVTGRLCSRCTEWGSWARPTTALGMFLRALGGVGLLYQLQSYTEPDKDECWTQEEVQAAAEILGSESDAADEEGDEDDGQEAREDAERLRDLVFSHWRGAAESLHRSQATLAHFSWLEAWSRPWLAAKAQYLETLRRSQAALFVEPAGLLVAAAAAILETPRLPDEDAAFAVLGGRGKVSAGLSALWRRWQSAAESGWAGPRARSYISYYLVQDIRSNRKGHDEARTGAARLVESWEEQARALATSAEGRPTRLVTARLLKATDDTSRGVQRGLLEGLDLWAQGVVAVWAVDADWGRRTVTLDVPALVADRLLGPSSSMTCEPSRGEADPTEPSRGPAGRQGTVSPGVFDDTPVFDRRPITAEHIHALRTFSPGTDQLYIVFSVSGGAEVLPLDVIEGRLAQGWVGALVAGAADLPAFGLGSGRSGAAPARVWWGLCSL